MASSRATSSGESLYSDKKSEADSVPTPSRSSARDRLSGALTSALDKNGTGEYGSAFAPASAVARAGIAHGLLDGMSDFDPALESPLKILLRGDNSPWSSPAKSPMRHGNRRRRRKDPAAADGIYHHTFVMKLFDRSVDLAQFAGGHANEASDNGFSNVDVDGEDDNYASSHSAALYPVCRAWMKNQPQNKALAPRPRTPTPEPSDDPDDDEEEAESGNESETQEDKNVEPEADKKPEKKKGPRLVYHLPHCRPLKSGKEGGIRIPEPVKRSVVKTVEINKLDKSNPTELLRDHMLRWQETRRRWRQAYARNENRYTDSIVMLQNMFQK